MKIVNPRPTVCSLLAGLDVEKWIDDCFRSLVEQK